MSQFASNSSHPAAMFKECLVHPWVMSAWVGGGLLLGALTVARVVGSAEVLSTMALGALVVAWAVVASLYVAARATRRFEAAVMTVLLVAGAAVALARLVPGLVQWDAFTSGVLFALASAGMGIWVARTFAARASS